MVVVPIDMQQVHTATRLRKVRCSQVSILGPVVMDPKDLLDLMTSWQIMELVTLGMDKFGRSINQ